MTHRTQKNADKKAQHAGNENEAPPKPVQLPAEGFVRQPVVLALFGTSRATLWRWIGGGQFPRPYKVAAGTNGWDVQELREHMAKIRAARNGDPR